MLNISQTFGCAEIDAMAFPLRPVVTSLTWPGLLLAFIAAFSFDVGADDSPPAKVKLDAAQEEFFEARVRPVLVSHCLMCHGSEKHKGGLRLDARDAMFRGSDSGPVVIPGKPEESSLIKAIGYGGDVQMPPSGKLKDAEIAALTDWVKQGAHWPDVRPGAASPAIASTNSISHVSTAALDVLKNGQKLWSLQPVKLPALPAVHNGVWCTSPIDRFVLAKLEQIGLAPSPAANKRILIRRATFDLIGLPPTPEEIDAFLQDGSSDAFARVVDRLLASPHYGERWGRYWLDVARFGEDQAHSFQPRLYPSGYRYRDWLLHALNQDLPYDRFVMEQIAGDLIDGPGRLERLAALGFFACGPVYYGDAKKHDQYSDRVDTLTRGFLGLTVACARCHDHKYDPVPTTDYYALAGIFASSEYTEVPAAPKELVEAYEKAQAAIQTKQKEITSFLKAEAERSKQKVPNDQLKQFERMLPAEAKAKVKALRTELDRLKQKAPTKYPVIHTLADAATPTDMPVLVRGNPETPGAKVPRRFLTVLGGDRSTFKRGSGRLELACAIASKDNPLTARVMVNRIWQHHFGRGLVTTSSNFGTLGEQPTHPELLDWLAHRFVASGWALKPLHREIMLSAVYQQTSGDTESGRAKDPGNALLWRMNRSRLDIEAWRDAILVSAGRLDVRFGGPSASLESGNNQRRTVYAAVSRHDLAWMLRLFDFPDPNITSDRRVETTVPLQQLFVLNSEFMAESARFVAARLLGTSPGMDGNGRIRYAYLLLYGRTPTDRELNLGKTYLHANDPKTVGAVPATAGPSRWEHYAQALLATNEFLFID
jgi:mono/diheme cytochrome c family protein